MTFAINFLPHNSKIEVEPGESLIRAAMEAGVHINASCGGGGVCGKCRVLIESGEVEGGISEHLSETDREKGYRLACISSVKSDLTVRIPVESQMESSRLNQAPVSRHTARAIHTDVDELMENGMFLPPTEKIYLELDPAQEGDNQADVARIINHLRLNHDEHRLTLNLALIRRIPDILRQGEFKITVTIVRPVRRDGKNEIINVEPGDTTDRNYAIAVDIGTTTVYGQLLDTRTGEVVAQRGEFNGQISYGEDVISRIIFAEKGDGLDILQKKVVDTINAVIARVVKKGGIQREDVSTITLAGNSTMTQLLLHINPTYIRKDPYVPAAIMYPPFHAHEIGLELADHAVALIYPGVSSYVGGDIVSGIMASGMYKGSELTLFMDIGTNAEIVIGHEDWLVCTAASAGPAFEGGGVKFGMRATKGAIEDVSINPETLEPMIITVGNTKAKGICGSGLITLAARMLETGIIDSRGKFNQDLPNPRIRMGEDEIWEYVLVQADDTQIDRDITITEPDLDNLIRAKGAMYSAALTLLEEIGLTVNDLERIILAGGFGSYVDLESAITIGLLPEIEPDKVTYLGNGSLLGARINCLTNTLRRNVAEVVNKITNFELASTPSYMDHYMGALFLPHTEMNYFPKVKARLETLRQGDTPQ